MHRELLSGIHHQVFLSILLRVLFTAQLVAVPDRKQHEPLLIEPAQPAVGHIPAEHIVADLIVFMALCLPVLRRPRAERGKVTVLFLQEELHVLDNFIDLGTFHKR